MTESKMTKTITFNKVGCTLENKDYYLKNTEVLLGTS